jgi:peptidoglycan lytic transglycosylase
MTPPVARSRLRRRTLALGLILSLAGVAVACGRGVQPPPPNAPEPEWLAEPLDSAAALPAPAPVEPVPGMVHNTDDAVFDPDTVKPLLSDPRFAEVHAQRKREAVKGAADAFESVMKKQTLSDEDEPRWLYVLGRLRLQAGDPAAAVRAFDRAASVDWALKDYALFHAGNLLTRMHEPREGLARLTRIPTTLAIADEVALATAFAHVENRDVDAAQPIYDAYLARRPRPKGWVLVALRYAKALLNQPSVERAHKAVQVAREVIYNGPGGKGVGEARELEGQALGTIPSTRRRPLDKPELSVLIARARDLAAARQGREARRAADVLLEKLKKDDGSEDETPGEAACEAYLARAKGLAVVKRYNEASEAAETAVARCEGQAPQVRAFFLAGRYAWRGGRAAAARRHYTQLEKRFGDHRYADDARLHGAEVAREMGDVAAFTRALRTIAEDYPEGDMVDQALFVLALDRIEAGDWAGAKGPLERAVKRQKRGRPYYAEGRAQYYLARARIETGQVDDGLRELGNVIRDFPLSYYMVQAYARLHHRDADRARRVVHDALAREPDGAFVIADHAELHRPGFLRAAELVRVGDSERALAELEALGLRGDDAHPSLVWASALLLSRLDAPSVSHGVLRSSTKTWREHFPAGVWRELWQVAYPQPFAAIVQKEIARSKIPEHLAYAIMREESAFKPRAVSWAGAYGLMQLIVPTASRVARRLGLPSTKTALRTPEVNIALGCRFLWILTGKFPFNPVLAIPGYNAGPGAPKKWLEQRPGQDFDVWIERIPYKETRHYTKRVLQSMAAYAMLYGKGMADDMMLLPLLVAPPDVDSTAGR